MPKQTAIPNTVFTRLDYNKMQDSIENQLAKQTVVEIRDYNVPVCIHCGGQLKDFFSRVRTCNICGKKSSSQGGKKLSELLSENSMMFLMLSAGIVGGLDNLLEITASFDDDGVFLKKKGALAGSLPGAFRWVRKGVGIYELSRHTDILFYHKAGIPISRKDFYDVLSKFYSADSRKIYHQFNTGFDKSKETKEIDKVIKSYLHEFVTKYYPLFRAFGEGDVDDATYEKLSEAMAYGIFEFDMQNIRSLEPLKVKSILHILKFCSVKKLATNIVSPFTRKLKIIYDLPLELIYDDLQYEKQL